MLWIHLILVKHLNIRLWSQIMNLNWAVILTVPQVLLRLEGEHVLEIWSSMQKLLQQSFNSWLEMFKYIEITKIDVI